MTTWHQNKNPEGIRDAYTQHPTKWKVVNDKYDRPLSVMIFGEGAEAERQARVFAGNTGGVVIAPKER